MRGQWQNNGAHCQARNTAKLCKLCKFLVPPKRLAWPQNALKFKPFAFCQSRSRSSSSCISNSSSKSPAFLGSFLSLSLNFLFFSPFFSLSGHCFSTGRRQAKGATVERMSVRQKKERKNENEKEEKCFCGNCSSLAAKAAKQQQQHQTASC